MRALKTIFLCFGTFALATGASTSVAGQAQAEGWSGVYDLVGDLTVKSHEPAGFKPAPNIAKLEATDDLDALDELVKAHLQPWAVAKMNTTDSAVDDLGAICGPTGIFRYPVNTGGMMWLQTPTKILIVWDYLNEVGVRRIYLTDKHPRNLAPTWDGHSIGHWEGKTLVVDTIGFNDKSWLQTSMQPHTEELHVVERISAVDDGSILEIRTTVADREALTTPYSYTRHFKKINAEFGDVEYLCNREPGDQQMWNYMRDSALKKFEKRSIRDQ